MTDRIPWAEMSPKERYAAVAPLVKQGLHTGAIAKRLGAGSAKAIRSWIEKNHGGIERLRARLGVAEEDMFRSARSAPKPTPPRDADIPADRQRNIVACALLLERMRMFHAEGAEAHECAVLPGNPERARRMARALEEGVGGAGASNFMAGVC